MENRLFLEQTTDIVEGLCNLTYLICEEAEHPERVRFYASISEERLRAMINLIHAEW